MKKNYLKLFGKTEFSTAFILILFIFNLCGNLSAQQFSSPNKIRTTFSEDFIHDSRELYDQNIFLSALREKTGLSEQEEFYFFQYIKSYQQEVFFGYLKQVKEKKVTKNNADKYWLDLLPEFAKKYSEFNLIKKSYIKKHETNIITRTPSGNNQINATNCNNSDFSSGNLTNWTGKWNSTHTSIGYYGNPPTAGTNLGATNSWLTVHQIMNGGNDPYAGAAIPCVKPGNAFSLRLGNDCAYTLDAGYYNCQRIRQSFVVTPSNSNFTYSYAVVLHSDRSAPHATASQPFFKIRMYDGSNNVIACASYDVNANSAATIGGFSSANFTAFDKAVYKGWSDVLIPLNSYMGQNVTIEFETSDCNGGGGHFGYAYISATCAPLEILSSSPTVCNNSNVTLTAPSGAATYNWTTTGGNIVSGANTATPTINAGGSYTVTMTTLAVPPQIPCTFSLDTIIPSAAISPTANFINNVACLGSATNFTDQTTGSPISWNWNFGDTQASSSQNPSHTYTAAGTYTVTLTASNGCTDTYSTTVNVGAVPIPNFTTNTVCAGNTTNFTNNTPALPAITNWAWDFTNNGSTDNTAQNTSNNYGVAGTYTASLTATTALGCSATYTTLINVNANPSPTFTSNSVCLTTGTQFTNTTAAVPAITTWAWDFTNNASTDDATSAPSFTYPTAGTFTASLTATTTAGCVGTFTNTVTVNPNPVASFTATTVCLNTATSFDNSASTIASPDNIAFYNWTFGDAQNASGSNTSHTYASCGSFTANLTVVSNNNCVNSTTGTITVKCIPTVTVPTNTIVCPATAIAATNFTSNPAGATYTWSNTEPNINLGASGTGDIPTFNTTNNGSTQLDGAITVTPTLLGCVGTPNTYTVSVRPTPVMNPIANESYCPSQASAASNFSTIPAGSTFTWTNTNTTIGLSAGSNGQYASFTTTNSGATVLSGVVQVTPTLNTCVGLPISYTIDVKPTPVATVPANATYCSLDIVPATGFNSTPVGASFAWTNTNATIGLAASGNGQIPSFSSANTTSNVQTGIVAVTPTLNSCVGLPVNYTITVNPTPIISPIANVLECPAVNVPTNVIVSTPAGASFAWTNSNSNVGLAAASGTGNITSFTTSNLTSSDQVSTITITPTLNSCVGPNVSYTITVKPTPVLTVPASASYCPNTTTVPSPNFSSVPTGATTNWTNSNTSIGLAASGVNDYLAFTPLNSSSINQIASITATPTLNSCVGLPQTYSITVFPKPVATVPSNSEACPGDNVNGFVFGSVPNDPSTNYNWIHTNGNIGLTEGTTAAEITSSSSSFVATNTNNVFITSTFTLITDLNGCFSDPKTFTFTVNPLPIAIFGNNHTCYGDATQFNSNSSVGSGSIVTHQWDYNNDNIFEVSGNNPSPSTILSTIGNQNIHLNVITDKGCATDTVIAMYVNPNPVPTISVDDPDGCPDHFVNLAGAVQGSSVDHSNSIVSWAWDFESNSSLDHTSLYGTGSQSDSLSHTYVNTSPTQSAFYQVTLTVTSDSSCVGTSSTNPTFITVFANPIADFSYGPSDPLPGVDNPLVQFIDESQGASNWTWDFGDPYSVVAANGSHLQTPQHYYDSYDAQTYNVTLIINNGQCWDTVVKPVVILPNWTFYIPNAFSPNDDGINDGFRATGVGIKDFKLYIFDRWGEQIWYSDDLEKYWDGKVMTKNKIVQEDVYIWKAVFKDGKNTKHILSGHVTVVR